MQLVAPRERLLAVEESLAALAAVLIVGLADQRVDILQILWLAAVASGVLARGGRVHWVGRALLLGALAMPFVIDGDASAPQVGLCVAAVALLLTCGRVTNELRALLDRARYEADHDPLTGALSRSAFHRELADRDHATEGAGVGLLIVDLDDFGQVNKLHGHAAGDAVLSRAAERLREAGGADAVLGRLGGDELGLIVAPERAAAVAAAAHEALSGPLGPATLGASIGVAVSPRHGRDYDALMRAADVALRVAKRSGRGQVQTFAGEDFGRRGPSGARGALERLIRGEGLTMAVQPIVDWRAGRIHAGEALARFQTRSEAGPLHWFALADEFGLRDELELACLRAALDLYAGRPAGVAVTVNLSGPVLLDPRATETLCEVPDLSAPGHRGHRGHDGPPRRRPGRRDRAAARSRRVLRRRRHRRRLLGPAADHRARARLPQARPGDGAGDRDRPAPRRDGRGAGRLRRAHGQPSSSPKASSGWPSSRRSRASACR